MSTPEPNKPATATPPSAGTEAGATPHPARNPVAQASLPAIPGSSNPAESQPPASPDIAGTEAGATAVPPHQASGTPPVAQASLPAKPATATASGSAPSAQPATGPGRSVISARGLVKVYGQRTVVGGVDIRVSAGEIVGLLGPNGAGKTTTFYMIVGLVPATRGNVLLDDRPITKMRMHQRARAGLGYLPQEPSIFRTLTVEENVRAVVETIGLPRRLHAARTKEHLDELGLWHLAKQRAYTLSGGERRRLEIARALVTRPKFLLMDEPFSGVDPISVAEVQKIVLDLKKRGIGILITDHNVRETLRIVDRAYLIHQGRVLTEGTGEFLIGDPKAREFYLGEDFNL